MLAAPASEAELAEAVRCHNGRAVIVGVERYVGPLYEVLGREGKPGRSAIARFGVGHDRVGKALARRRGIVVTNTPGVLDVSVGEHAIWLLGALLRHVAALDAEVKAGAFRPRMGAYMFMINEPLIPSMVRSGYRRGFAGAVNAAAATIGPVVPPSVGFIIYASLTGQSVGTHRCHAFIANTPRTM